MKTIFLLLGIGLSVTLSAGNIKSNNVEPIHNHNTENCIEVISVDNALFNFNHFTTFNNCQFCNYNDFYFFPVTTMLEEIDLDIYNYRYEEELNQAAQAASIMNHSVVLEEIELDLKNSDYEEELLMLEN